MYVHECVYVMKLSQICGLLGLFFDFSLFSLECCKLCYSSNFCDMFSVSVPKNFIVNHFLAKIAKKKKLAGQFLLLCSISDVSILHIQGVSGYIPMG